MAMQDIYGLYVAHPADVVQNGWRDGLPDITGKPVYYFSTLDGVQQGIHDCSRGAWTFRTAFGMPPRHLDIGSVGVVYTVPVSDELVQYAEKQRVQTANPAFLFSAPLPSDKIQNIAVCLPEDALHAQETVPLEKAASCLEQRREHLMRVEDLLHNSTQAQRDKFNLEDARESLRFLFGNNGLLTSEEYSNRYTTLQNILYNVFAANDVNITYATQTEKYREIIDKSGSDMLQQLYAAQNILDIMADIADTQGDFKVRSVLYSIQNKTQRGIRHMENR